MNHFQNGGWLVSSVVCQYWSQARSSAYSTKHSGKYVSLKRSAVAGSLRLACPTNFADGRKYSSSFQCTAICASFSRCFGLLLVLLAALRALATAMAPPGSEIRTRSYDEELPRRSEREELWSNAQPRTRLSFPTPHNAPAIPASQPTD